MTEKNCKGNVKKVVTFRAYEQDINRWKEEAKILGITMSELIVKKMNETKVKIVKTKKADPNLVRLLVRIGNNINQIARSINSNKDYIIDKDNLIEALTRRAISELEELRKEIEKCT